MITEDHLEQLALTWFQETGWSYLPGPDIAPEAIASERADYGVVVLKNARDVNADVWEAYAQIQTYKEEIEDLFVFNEALVVSDGIHARIGALTASKEWFMPWRTIGNAKDQPALQFELEKVVRGFF